MSDTTVALPTRRLILPAAAAIAGTVLVFQGLGLIGGILFLLLGLFIGALVALSDRNVTTPQQLLFGLGGYNGTVGGFGCLMAGMDAVRSGHWTWLNVAALVLMAAVMTVLVHWRLKNA
jgi:hypothetical protein